MRTAKGMGIHTVAVYSEADALASHVKLADEAYCIGPAPTGESYLRADKIIQVALAAGAEAIHPGYGFLSENAVFAEKCAAAGICFIGPPPEAIRAMGEKSTAKRRMEQAGVPVIKGYHGEDQSDAALRQAADEIGYPVLIKAVAGGGGKGMRAVNNAKDFLFNLEAARGEAKASFGDDRVLLEKYLSNPRHVEVQVFADNQGHAVFLFERDCSVQRRHQKIIEEAPAPGVDTPLRHAIGNAAVNAAKAINYRGAGTIEFLLDENKAFYFMEMNTRLQVEHPVTEMITGLDLVEWQLRVAYGEALPIVDQRQLSMSGHAFEARIYAEDPQKDFMPSIGLLKYFSMPSGSFIREDSGVTEGDTISVYYDPMIAKLIVWGEDRETALSRFVDALSQVQVIGVQTNISLLSAVALHPAFSASQLTTHFIEQHHQDLFTPQPPASINLIALMTLATLWYKKTQAKSWQENTNDEYSPWFAGDSWRANISLAESIRLHEGESHYIAVVEVQSEDPTVLTIDNTPFTVKHFSVSSIKDYYACEFSAVVNDEFEKATIVFYPPLLHVFSQGRHHVFSMAHSAEKKEDQDATQRIVAPMPGTLTEIFVSPGQEVKKGDRLLVVEAMKMQHTLYAPVDCKIKDVFFKSGDLVMEGAQLIQMD